jgi:hypothetical protein
LMGVGVTQKNWTHQEGSQWFVGLRTHIHTHTRDILPPYWQRREKIQVLEFYFLQFYTFWYGA